MMRAGRTRAALTALLAASALAVTGCGAEDSGSAAAEKPEKAAEAKPDDSGKDAQKDAEKDAGKEADAGSKPAPASLKFSSTTLDGKAFQGKKLADKPAVLWFWAPWCGTCRGQAAQTAQLADKYKGKVNFVGVAGLDKTQPMHGFVKTQKVGNFPHLNDQKGSVWEKFGITQQSSYVMLDKDGKTVHTGTPSSPDELNKLVSGLAG